MRAASRHPQASAAQPLAWHGARALLIGLVALALLAAVGGGLLRAGIAWPAALHADAFVATAALSHAALMMSGFLGTVIGIERAVALKLRWAFAAPFCSGSAALLLLAGHGALAAWLGLLAAAVFVAVNITLVRRQRAPHTAVLLLGALAWAVGNATFALGAGTDATLPWWFAFLVLTILAERLEMTRLMRHHPAALPLLITLLGLLLAGAALASLAPVLGAGLYGLALLAVAGWLAVFDIARRTVRARGLSRYMALCLLGGYAWLAIAGLAWAAMPLLVPARDVALHALGLGFVFSMVMGHAPVILPAVARIKLQFGPWFYAPLALLHGSLLLRCTADLLQPAWRGTGALLNAAALALFAATVAGSAIAWRTRGHAGRLTPDLPLP